MGRSSRCRGVRSVSGFLIGCALQEFQLRLKGLSGPLLFCMASTHFFFLSSILRNQISASILPSEKFLLCFSLFNPLQVQPRGQEYLPHVNSFSLFPGSSLWLENFAMSRKPSFLNFSQMSSNSCYCCC